MASIGHVAVGMAAARFRRNRPVKWTRLALSMAAWSALSLLPDADVIGRSFGVRYASALGHRGATHSIAFALGVAVLVGVVAGKLQANRWSVMGMAALVLLSHPLLDTLTDGGRGCALFWPFSTKRYFAPWNPIPVAPLGLRFLSRRGLFVALHEFVLFAPLFLYALWPRRRF